MATAVSRPFLAPTLPRGSTRHAHGPQEDRTGSKDKGSAIGALIGFTIGIPVGIYVGINTAVATTGATGIILGPAAPAAGVAAGIAAGVGVDAALTGIGAAIGGAIGTLAGDDDPAPPPATESGPSGDPGGSLGIGPFSTGEGGPDGGQGSGQDAGQGDSGSSGGSGGCFLGGTPVLLADGTSLPIEGIPLGTLVVAQDPFTGNVSAQPTTQTFTHHVCSTLLLLLSDGTTLHTTRQHRFFVPERGFLAAGQLTPGMSVVTLSNQYLTVLGTSPVEEDATVYNLEVAHAHTYFVGPQGVWVHNDKITEPPD